MIDFESTVKAIRANWMPKLKQEASDWSFFGNQYLNSLGPHNLHLFYNFTSSGQFPLIKNIPIFYQNVLLTYNGTKTVTPPDSCMKLIGEVLWGNVVFTCYNTLSKQNETLFFRSWVSSGITTLKCIQFTNGVIDEVYIYNKITDKRNIYCEILLLKKALAPYKDMLLGYSSILTHNEPPDLNITEALEFQQLTSKSVYKSLVKKKFESPFQELV